MFYLQKWFGKRTARGYLQPKCQKFSRLFPKSVVIEQVATGFQFTEGPVWMTEDQCLLFSDIPANKIYKLNAARQAAVFREPSHHSNGLTRDGKGRLIACEHGSRCITRTELDGTLTVFSDRFGTQKLNSPNDVIVKSDGAIYFTDPPYGIQPEQQELPFQGVYRLSPTGQDLTVVADDFVKPNGLALSPDEQTLYIADSSERCHIRAFDVQADGTLTNCRVFHTMKAPGATGNPDGMKVDREGRLYATGPGGVWVLEPNGTHLGTIVLPEQPANCAWGDADWQSLYITARTSLYKIRVNTPGIAVP
ncbi:Gluconolactonase (plasmid) [Crinalium epipsammum PCC 9333]|uniref:Gluconolactonase n=1 Tax=Crinalium epipsammum PCC 9333 TaxID=1173022 RepID=K9W634_9CYAN|nr:Gluconolactonase [Crinalium epipsammum PCC 9333]